MDADKCRQVGVVSVQLCDVTLREGDQMPGRDYSVEQKVEAAHHLDSLGVKYIQPAFPATGTTDQTVVRELAGTLDADIMSLARAIPNDVQTAIDAGTDVVEIIIPLSDKQLTHTVGKSRAEMLDALEAAVTLAQDERVTVHIGIMDAFRTPISLILEIIDRFPDVELFNLPDTVGATTPPSVTTFLDTIAESVDLSRVGVHFHDDLGVGTANALTASRLGVAKADVSVGSLGERAGNSSLEELVVAGTTDLDDQFGIEPTELIPICRSVLDILNEDIDPRKPILGHEVTEHESGMHTTAMLDDPSVFEPYNPAAFGGERRLIFGTGTGRGGARKLLERADLTPTTERIDAFLDALATHGPLDTEAAIDLAHDEFT